MLETRFHLDNKKLVVEQSQDVEPVLEWNKEARRDYQDNNWGRHVARIPNVIYVKWFNDEIAKGNTALRMYSAEFDEIAKRKLQDPEWAYLRTDRPALITGWVR